MPLPSVTFRSELTPIVRKELDQLDGELGDYLLAEHDDDGHHKHITAQSIVIAPGPATITGPLTITGPATITGPTTIVGSTTLQGPLSVTGNAGVGGNLTVTGWAQASAFYEFPRALPLGYWQPYTPVWATGGTPPAIGNGSITGRYMLVGRTCFFGIVLQSGSTTTFGTAYYTLSLPLAGSGSPMHVFPGMYTNGNKFNPIAGVMLGATTIVMYHLTGNDYISSTNPFAAVANDRIWITGNYEIL